MFTRHGVEFLVIGGVAVRLYGASRVTEDMDVVASREIANLDRVAAALREMGAFLRVGGLDDETARSLPVILDGDNLANLDVSTWRTDAGDIDILAVLRSEDGSRIEYNDLRDRGQRSTLGGIEVTLASLDDIIASKRFADRPKDREALPELIALRDGPK